MTNDQADHRSAAVPVTNGNRAEVRSQNSEVRGQA
jgi:hypothetical protein